MNRKLLLPLILLITCGNAFGQTERFELGQRLRACEAAWDRQSDAVARRLAVERLKKSVNLFFSLKLKEAGRELDLARLALSGIAEPPAERMWAESLYISPAARLIDAGREELSLELRQLYPEGAEVPKKASLRLTLLSGGRRTGDARGYEIAGIPQRIAFNLKSLPEGDYTLRAEVMIGGRVLAATEQTVSAARNLAARIASLRAQSQTLESSSSETVRSLAALLGALADGQTMETNYPAARLLREAEEAAAGKRTYGGAGQFWMTLKIASGTVPVRLQAPRAGGSPMPLVIALHGAGGSENLFFDGYGNGAIARLCEERGWLLVAPRGTTGFTPGRAAEIIDSVAELYPVDRGRAFLVGHSMGAAQAVASAQSAPRKFAALAALGGGGQIQPDSAIADLPFFIGAGSEDFALANARRLESALKTRQVKRIVMREYPDVEHLVVVQVALPDVFRFLDEVSETPKR